MKNIGQTSHDARGPAPVMVLPNATLFPNTLMPLRIFEPRYRQMLQWCLERERMFCVALTKPGVSEARSPADYHQVAGLGLVRACVGCADGTSNLVLQGLSRVRFTGFLQEQPFPLAAYSPLVATVTNAEEAEALTAQVMDLCVRLRAAGLPIPTSLDAQVARARQAGAPDIIIDVVAHTLLQDPQRRQSVLEPVSVNNRLHLLLQHLREEMTSGY